MFPALLIRTLSGDLAQRFYYLQPLFVVDYIDKLHSIEFSFLIEYNLVFNSYTECNIYLDQQKF